jgi:hypothetical protein
MAKVTYGVPINEDVDVSFYYGNVTFDDKDSSSKKLVYVDQDSGAEIIFKGKGLDVDKHGLVDKGQVKEVDLVDGQGKPLVTLHFQAHDKITGQGLHDAYVTGYEGQAGVLGEFEYIFKNNDRINGSKGGDYIVGWGGNDTIDGKAGNDFIAGFTGKDHITGGTGDDVFMFGPGYGKDVVDDFDAHGEKDQIWAITDDYKVRKDGNDTVIDFGHGDTLTLLHVKHLSDADFFHP